MSPTAAELDAVFAWTARHAPSPLARVIAGVAIRNSDLSIGGIRNVALEKAMWPKLTRADLGRAFLRDRALIVDASCNFEDQVLQALVYLQGNPLGDDPDRAFASNVQSAFSRQYGESLTLGAVIVAALACGYVFDPDFTEQERDQDGDAFFLIPEIRFPALELFSRGRM